jgi:hypothetical protein
MLLLDVHGAKQGKHDAYRDDDQSSIFHGCPSTFPCPFGFVKFTPYYDKGAAGLFKCWNVPDKDKKRSVSLETERLNA